MLRVSALVGRRVNTPKAPKRGADPGAAPRYSKIGKVHMAVFSPDGGQVVGLMVRRPDIATVVKRNDVFVAWDSYAIEDKVLVVTRPKDGIDDAARSRLGIDWDACILWEGMDVVTTEGKTLGYINDAEFDETTGRVRAFFSMEGGISQAIVGSFVITPDMVRGYSKGAMVVDTGGVDVVPEGGLAGKAGEAYAKAKAKGIEAGKAAGETAAKAGKAAGAAVGEAVNKGSFALGKTIGKMKRAYDEHMADDEDEADAPAVPAVEAADVRVSEPVVELTGGAPAEGEAPEPKTYIPAPEATSTNTTTTKAKPKTQTAGDKVAKAVGRQLGSLGKMFGSFKDEFDKASK